MNPSESTPANNTHRQAAARSRTGNDSCVESENLEATLVHRPNPKPQFRIIDSDRWQPRRRRQSSV